MSQATTEQKKDKKYEPYYDVVKKDQDALLAAGPAQGEDGSAEPDDDGSAARAEEEAAIASIIEKIKALEPVDPLLKKKAQLKVRQEQFVLAEYLWNVYQKEGQYLVIALCKLCESFCRLEKCTEAKAKLDEARKQLDKLTDAADNLKFYVDAEEALYMIAAGELDEGKKKLDEVYTAWATPKAEDDNDEHQFIRMRCCLGHLAQKEEDYDKAIEILKAVADQEEIKDVYLLKKATATFELALCHYQKDEPEPALERQEAGTKILEDLNAKLLLPAQYEVFALYQEKQKNYVEAIGCLRKVIDMRLAKAKSEEDPEILRARQRIAMNLFNMNMPHEAIKELQGILDIEIKVYGEDSRQVAKTYKALGQAQQKAEQFKQAKESYMKAKPLFEAAGDDANAELMDKLTKTMKDPKAEKDKKAKADKEAKATETK